MSHGNFERPRTRKQSLSPALIARCRRVVSESGSVQKAAIRLGTSPTTLETVLGGGFVKASTAVRLETEIGKLSGDGGWSVSAAIRIVDAPLLGVRPTGAFVDRYDESTGGMIGSVEVIDVPIHPPSPEGKRFRSRREQRGLSMGDVARAFGCSVVDVSGVERGLKLPEDWASAFAALETIKPSRTRGGR